MTVIIMQLFGLSPPEKKKRADRGEKTQSYHVNLEWTLALCLKITTQRPQAGVFVGGKPATRGGPSMHKWRGYTNGV